MNFYPLAVDRHSRLIELKFTLCINPTFIVVVRTSVWKHKFKGWKRRFDRYVLTLHAFNNWSIAFPDSVPFSHLSYQRLVKAICNTLIQEKGKIKIYLIIRCLKKVICTAVFFGGGDVGGLYLVPLVVCTGRNKANADLLMDKQLHTALSFVELGSGPNFHFCMFSLSGRYSELHVQYNEAVNTVKEQKELITQLETDLLSVNALPSAFRGQGEVRTNIKFEKKNLTWSSLKNYQEASVTETWWNWKRLS